MAIMVSVEGGRLYRADEWGRLHDVPVSVPPTRLLPVQHRGTGRISPGPHDIPAPALPQTRRPN
jgi:hypothetical protein